VEEQELDFLAALNVTIYGLGIVFLALLVLMFTIMVLSKLFSVATGKSLMEAPNDAAKAEFALAAAPAPATPVAAAAAGAPLSAPAAASPAAQPVAPPVVLALSFGGEQHRAELKEVTSSGATVVMDGVTFRVERDKADVKTVMVNGKAHTLEVREVTDTATSVVIDGVAQTIQISRESPVTPAAPAPATRVVKKRKVVSGAMEQVTAPLPGKILSVAVQVGDTVKAGDELCVIEAMKMGNSIKAQRDGTVKEVAVTVGQMVGFGATLITLATGDVVEEEIEEVVAPGVASTEAAGAPPQASVLSISADGKQYKAEVHPAGDGAAKVTINGAVFQVARDPRDVKTVVVNGRPHTVEVKEVTDATATVVIDGVERKIGLTREPVSAQPASAAAPIAAAPTPAPAPPPASSAPAPAAGGEPITAPLPGKVLSVAVKAGDRVNKGDELCVIEAMKMGNSIKAQRAGTIQQVLVSPGQTVGFGATLFVME
jgi:glutaconyl-CoA decarboxylase